MIRSTSPTCRPLWIGCCQVAGRLELAEDLYCGALGDPDQVGDVADPQLRVAGQGREHVEVVGETGTVWWLQIDIDESAEDLDHLITPEERLAVAMTRQ
jgi:hypothetical protein